MQDNSRKNIKQGAQDQEATLQVGFDRSNGQPFQHQHSQQLERSATELSGMDQQEGNMNNGRLGGNFEENETDLDYEQHSPPY